MQYLPASSSTETLPAEEVEENKELDDGLWDDDDDDKEEENPPKVCMRDCKQHYNGWEVDDRVDVGVPQLRDYLSDCPALSPLVNVREGLNLIKKLAGSSVPKVFEVQDIMF